MRIGTAAVRRGSARRKNEPIPVARATAPHLRNVRYAMLARPSHASLSLVVSRDRRDTSDGDLARGLVAGEAWAIAETWHRFAPMVITMAERCLGSRSEAEDIGQEVFYRVFRKAKTLRDPNSLRSFVYSFAIRALRTELRRKKLRSWLSVGPARSARGRGLPNVGRGVARSSAEVSCPARPPGAARSAGVHPETHGVHDGGGDCHSPGHLGVHGEAIDGTCFEPTVALDRCRPWAGRPPR